MPSDGVRVLALHGLLHLIGYDHEQDAGRMRRVERRLRRRAGCGTGLIEREVRGDDVVDSRPVRARARAVYVGTIEAAFSALMRLSLRLTAERTAVPDVWARISTIRCCCSCRSACSSD